MSSCENCLNRWYDKNMAYCDFCKCSDCQNGTPYIVHAQTSDNRWICDVCYDYEICQKFEERKGLGPCDDKNCVHRPKLISEWIK